MNYWLIVAFAVFVCGGMVATLAYQGWQDYQQWKRESNG